MNQTIVLLLLLLPLWTNAQIQVGGEIKDGAEAIAWANIIILNSAGEMIGGTNSQENGNFQLEIAPGSYTIQISYLGYTDWEKDLHLEKDYHLGTISLLPDANNLEEIVVVARKRLIEQKQDRMVFNVENSIVASGGDAMDLLALTPGLLLQNNELNIIGKGASRVMIDGRLIQLSGEELISFLNSIAADDIKKIEVISNPPTNYDAAGNGGLINIIYKKGRNNSWRNTSTLAYSQNKYQFATFRNNFSYNKNKLGLSISTNGSKGNNREIEHIDVFYPSETWTMLSDTKAPKDQVSGRIALDYEWTKNISLGAQYLGNYNRPAFNTNAHTDIWNSNQQLDSFFVSRGFNDRTIDNHSYNLHLLVNLDTLQRKISLDFDYFDYNNTLIQDNIVDRFSPTGEFLALNISTQTEALQNIDNFSAKVDMEHPLRFVDLSYGAKLSFLQTQNDLQNFNTISGNLVLDTTLSNEFDYKEQIHALYLSGSKKINKQWSVQLGFRLENTHTQGFSKTFDQKNENKYLKLFPTFYASYQKNEQHYFSFNYGKRVNRPVFRDLNPFRIYLNTNSYSEGNPFIRPSFSDNFEWNHTYKRNLITKMSLSITNDGFGTIFTNDAENNIQAVIRRNFYKSYTLGLGQIHTFDKISWWESHNQAFVFGYKTDLAEDINATPQNGLQAYLSTSNTFYLGKSTQLQVNFWYSTPHRSNLFEIGETYNFNIGFKQSFLKKNMQVSLLFNDIFNTASLASLASEVNGVKTIYGQNYSSRFLRCSLKYLFGNNKINVKERNFGNEDASRRSN